ncbi:MAG TPA: 50S ribosomal protein L6, partial [Thiolinea sp.]|nr:50S ribosomal protein L6 [Thiolinea sp.]
DLVGQVGDLQVQQRVQAVAVGFDVAAQVKNPVLDLVEFFNDIKFAIPTDVKIVCETPTAIVISGFEKQRVGQIAAEIRGFRPPEPYKGKGVKYADETVVRKEAKKK